LKAFTLIEVLVVVAILGLLSALAFTSYGPLLARAESVKSMANLRSLHTSLSGYIQDKAMWPQEPEPLWLSGDSDGLEDWWIEELKPYGAPPEIWRSPAIYRVHQKRDPKSRPRMHYTPSRFDRLALSPYRYATQPWLMEIGDMDGRGGLILFPDGSIRVISDFLPAQSN